MVEENSPQSDDLSARIRKAKETHAPQRKAPTIGTAYGRGFRIGLELLAGVVFGLGVGWWLDGQFGTRPWLMILLLFLGLAAGMLNVFRLARQFNAEDAARAAEPDRPEQD